MKQLISGLMAIVIFSISIGGCKSGPPVRRGDDAKNFQDASLRIAWSKAFEVDPNIKGVLVLTDPRTNKSWSIPFKDFLILKKAYSNWRVVEKIDPTITEIIEKDQMVYVKFNYIHPETKASILGGTFIINKKYIRSSRDKQTINTLVATNIGTGLYALLITILFIIAIL